MMNKKNLWFLTLFSLVLVLSIYYVTMPNDLLKASTASINSTLKKASRIKEVTKEADAIIALKVEDEAKTKDILGELQKKITNSDTSADEKNKAYEEIKTINNNSGLEESIEKKINNQYNCETFAKIDGSTVKIVVDKCDNSKSLANNIMRLVQEQFTDKMFISVKFGT
ncbi:MAG: SpoIIIAH-like family protein [Bacilli bacterium]|nr:SpoIIIAH-like family protein [Bacilli bacterium]